MKKFQMYVNSKQQPFAEGELRADKPEYDKHYLSMGILHNFDKLKDPKKITIKIIDNEEIRDEG